MAKAVDERNGGARCCARAGGQRRRRVCAVRWLAARTRRVSASRAKAPAALPAADVFPVVFQLPSLPRLLLRVPICLSGSGRTAGPQLPVVRHSVGHPARSLGHLHPLSAEAFGQRLSSPACGFSFPGGAPHADSNGRVVYFSERGVVSLMSPTGGCLQVTVLAGTIPKVAAKKPATFLRVMAHRTCARRAR